MHISFVSKGENHVEMIWIKNVEEKFLSVTSPSPSIPRPPRFKTLCSPWIGIKVLLHDFHNYNSLVVGIFVVVVVVVVVDDVVLTSMKKKPLGYDSPLKGES